MPNHARRHAGPRRAGARLARGAPQEPVRDDEFRQIQATTATRRSAPPSKQAVSPSPSSNAMTSKSMASSCCPSVGSSNGRSAGSTEPDASPKTSKRQSSPRSHGSSSPSPSCSRDASPGSQVNKRDFRVGLKKWYLYAARAGLLIGVANHRRDFQPQHDRPCRDWDKPARAAIVFIHNGAPSALVGCLGDLEVFQTERAMVRIAVRVLQLDLCHFRPLRYRGVGPPAVRFLPTTLLSRRKRNRLRESRGVSSSITIRSTAILSLTPMLPVSPHAHEVELLRAAPSRRAIPRAQDPTRHARRMEARRVTSRPRDFQAAAPRHSEDCPAAIRACFKRRAPPAQSNLAGGHE